MREAITITRVMPKKALVKVVSKSVVESRSFELVRLGYDRRDDWELGVVQLVGQDPDWEDLAAGDHVVFRSGGVLKEAGGKAGADVSRLVGERSGTMIIISPTDVVARLVLDG